MMTNYSAPCGATRCGKKAVRPPPAAFTLIELLVVIAVIAILAAILLPVLAHAKQEGEKTQCISNQKQLVLAWIMYADDSRGYLPPNDGEGNQSGDLQWCLGVLNDSPAGQPWNNGSPAGADTNYNYLSQSMIGPYCNHQTLIYRCPSDIWNCKEHGVSCPRVRSVSMNGFVGDPGAVNGASAWDGNCRAYVKQSDMVLPTPPNLIVFDDEQADSINDGCLREWGTGNINTWADLPASYHNGSCNFAYADGHVAIHTWLNQLTLQPVVQRTYNYEVTFGAQSDVVWFLQHASGPSYEMTGNWP